ncbi:MAG: DUF2726 domain-containing protein [Rhodanobacter sp.]
MSWILIAVVVFIALVALATLKSKQGGGAGTIGFPYQPAKALFSPAERSFLGVLEQAVGTDYRVFGKVRVADIATVKPGMSKSARQGALNRVAQKHFDFVVCGARDLNVVCVVELNDSSHSSQRAQARDELLVKICQIINLPLLQVAAKQSYVLQDLRTQFFTAVGEPQLSAAVGA